MHRDDDMKLPPGKTCGDCEHAFGCARLFGCPSTNTTCDWSPSRFVLRFAAPRDRTTTPTEAPAASDEAIDAARQASKEPR